MQRDRIKCRWKAESDLIGRCKLTAVCNDECIYNQIADSAAFKDLTDRYAKLDNEYEQLAIKEELKDAELYRTKIDNQNLQNKAENMMIQNHHILNLLYAFAGTMVEEGLNFELTQDYEYDWFNDLKRWIKENVRRKVMTEIKFKKLNEDAKIPEYKSKGAAGMDICAAESVTLMRGEFKIVKTGLACAIPEGYEIQVRPRSGLACKSGVTVINTPGTIDSDYRGEIGVGLINLGETFIQINKGDRIAQLVVNKIEQPKIEVVEELDETERGAGGFGSTGV